jgi:hypothetical protein
MILQSTLKSLYIEDKKSVSQIASELRCSQNKVTYWLQKYHIRRRSISEAVYIRSNPHGDPFLFKRPCTDKEWFLYGLGLGLFWGEGNKMNKNSVRLGNTDIYLIKRFLDFLKIIYQIDEKKLHFGLQLFNDIPQKKALRYWSSKLKVSKKQFQKVVVTKSIQKGTYRKKSEYGVLTVYFSNTKLRDIIMSAITKLRNSEYKPS